MKKFRIFSFVVAFLLFAGTAWPAFSMSVQVKSTPLRSSPSFLGNSVAPVAYGEQVEVLQRRGDWMEVDVSGRKRGWIHQSALNRKQIELRPGATDTQPVVSSEEVALAGKGFSASVEEQFKAKHGELNFKWVDRIERYDISPKEMLSFLETGGLETQLGGVK